jgi:uncharacterized protein
MQKMNRVVKTFSRARRDSATILLVTILLSLPACGQSGGKKPTPEAAKQFLKLRGYEFDEKSFLAAAGANDVIAVNGFLAGGMSPNVKDDSSGATALISAAWHGNEEIVNVLLQGGADVNLKDNAGYPAILRALQNKHDEIADALLSRPNLDLNAKGLNGTVLMSYVRGEQEGTVKKLLERGADPNLSDEDGDTALHGAAQRGNVNVLKMLLAAGANPNAKNKLGGTALMWAGVYGHEEVARVLIDHGADAALKDEDGMTASAWAAKNNQEDLARLLRDAEKKR